jgi:hypothetical protein
VKITPSRRCEADPLPERHLEIPLFEEEGREPLFEPHRLELGVERGHDRYGRTRDLPDAHPIVLAGHALHQKGGVALLRLDLAETVLPGRHTVVRLALVGLREVHHVDPEGLVQHRLQTPGKLRPAVALLRREATQVQEIGGALVVALPARREEPVHRASGRAAVEGIRRAHGPREVFDRGLLGDRRRLRRRLLGSLGPGVAGQGGCERDRQGQGPDSIQPGSHGSGGSHETSSITG